MIQVTEYQNTSDLLKNCQSAQSYFNTLPVYIQENIKQCGVEITNEAQLHQLAQHLVGQK